MAADNAPTDPQKMKRLRAAIERVIVDMRGVFCCGEALATAPGAASAGEAAKEPLYADAKLIQHCRELYLAQRGECALTGVLMSTAHLTKGPFQWTNSRQVTAARVPGRANARGSVCAPGDLHLVCAWANPALQRGWNPTFDTNALHYKDAAACSENVAQDRALPAIVPPITDMLNAMSAPRVKEVPRAPRTPPRTPPRPPLSPAAMYDRIPRITRTVAAAIAQTPTTSSAQKAGLVRHLYELRWSRPVDGAHFVGVRDKLLGLQRSRGDGMTGAVLINVHVAMRLGGGAGIHRLNLHALYGMPYTEEKLRRKFVAHSVIDDVAAMLGMRGVLDASTHIPTRTVAACARRVGRAAFLLDGKKREFAANDHKAVAAVVGGLFSMYGGNFDLFQGEPGEEYYRLVFPPIHGGETILDLAAQYVPRTLPVAPHGGFGTPPGPRGVKRARGDYADADADAVVASPRKRPRGEAAPAQFGVDKVDPVYTYSSWGTVDAAWMQCGTTLEKCGANLYQRGGDLRAVSLTREDHDLQKYGFTLLCTLMRKCRRML